MKYIELIPKSILVKQIPLTYKGKKLPSEVAANIILLKASYNKVIQQLKVELNDLLNSITLELSKDQMNEQYNEEVNKVYNEAYLKKLQEESNFFKGITKKDWEAIYEMMGLEGTINYQYPNGTEKEIDLSEFVQYIGELINE